MKFTKLDGSEVAIIRKPDGYPDIRDKKFDSAGVWNASMDYLKGKKVFIQRVYRDMSYPGVFYFVKEGESGRTWCLREDALIPVPEVKPHKHAEMIKIWADNPETVFQFKIPPTSKWTDIIEPSWTNSYEYRVKPDNSEKINNLNAEIAKLTSELKRLTGELEVLTTELSFLENQ